MDAQAQLDGFIDKFTPDVAALTRALLARARAQLPGATIPVYDNYNALAIGFGATDRVKDVIFSLAVMPRWVTLCFTWGTRLDDPAGLLGGSGNQVRHLRLHSADAWDSPDVQAFLAQALARADRPIDPNDAGGLVIKSISAKQRPRRPA
ncbi:MAG: DUF1801 domain-containing protein [Sphingomonas sp.]|nr:DUF1801 domain-containing protein [Sphingomonas sp.]